MFLPSSAVYAYLSVCPSRLFILSSDQSISPLLINSQLKHDTSDLRLVRLVVFVIPLNCISFADYVLLEPDRSVSEWQVARLQ